MQTATSTTDSHRTKRPFQPSINSFFSRADQTPSHPDRDNLNSSRTPALPAFVQASLLNVGMRVRKSVPEGYKTHKTLLPSLSSKPSSFLHDKENIDMDAHRNDDDCCDEYGQHHDAHRRAVELQPFCGLLKVGGYAAQPESWSPAAAVVAASSRFSRPADVLAPTGDEEPFFSSQDSSTSAISTDSAPARRPGPLMQRGGGGVGGAGGAGKRVYDDFSDEEDEGESGGFVMPPTSLDRWMAMGFAGGARAIARPRPRRARAPVQVVVNGSVETVGESDDFGEADFLKPMEGEVEMGGV